MSNHDQYRHYDSSGRTHKGLHRSTNEDQFLVADLSKTLLVHQTSLTMEDRSRIIGRSDGLLTAVADGMGGHAGGEQASALALQAILEFTLSAMPWFLGLRHESDDDMRAVLTTSLEPCQAALKRGARAEPSHARMGTTLTMAYLLWPRAFIVHAGDSRCYLLRNGELHRVTRDHSVGQQLVDQGAWTQEQAEESPLSETLWNAITAHDEPPQAEVRKLTLHPGDTLLLCTDGLNKHVDDEQIRAMLGTARSATEAVDALIGATLEDGATDNVTAIVVRC